jgi:CBS domain-containing protein
MVRARTDGHPMRQVHDPHMSSTSTLSEDSVVPYNEALIADAMSHGVIHCAPETPLRTVARMMARYKVHAIYVFDYGDEPDEAVELWGLVSDLDVAAAACGNIDAGTAGMTAVSPLEIVTSDQPLRAAAELMALKSLTHLAVLDPETRRPIGVISTLDVARAVAASTVSDSSRSMGRVERYVVSARLKPGQTAEAERELAAGPPFEPAQAGLSEHAAYLSEDHVYLVFEGEHARNAALQVAREHLVEVSRWQRIVDGFPAKAESVPPGARCLYRWRAPRTYELKR